MMLARIEKLSPAFRKLGINVEIAEASEITGRVVLRITFPTERENQRRLIHVMRPVYGSRTVMKTHVVTRVSGYYKDHWEIRDQLSDIRSNDLEECLTNALHYVVDNLPKMLAKELQPMLSES